MSLFDRCGATVERVKAELDDTEKVYRALRAGLLEGLKRSRAERRAAALAKLATEFGSERTARLAEISGPYKQQRKRLQRLLDALEGETTDGEPEREDPKPASEPETPKRRRKGARGKK